ncbi:trypsin-like serine peptidase [Roseomonas sp. USHLN139]|uniref:trypsin-like serine peptidase n=1 Tax=Roseomonas sp. USHLN139 TaxID=3081298 RepID=UPI003B016700
MNLPDLNNRLFPPGAAPTHDPGLPLPQPSDPVERPGGPRGEAAGTEGAHFSSSRLIPVDARLEYPYRAVGKLFFQNAQGQDFVCTAAVIAPRLILTAGHCVHQGSGGEGGYFRHIQFVPAYHEGNAPFQRWSATWVATTKSWMTGGGGVPNRADLAIIELEERHFGTAMRTVGSVTGILGHRTNALSRNQAKIIGYPVGFDNGQIMHQVDSGSHRDGGLSSWLYGSDMTGGSSGGPWIENFGVRAIGQTGGLEANPNRIVGVTSYGFVSNQPLVQGSSVLGQEFLDLLSLACARRQGNC